MADAQAEGQSVQVSLGGEAPPELEELPGTGTVSDFPRVQRSSPQAAGAEQVFMPTHAVSMQGTPLTCTKMQLSSPASYCAQFCSQAPSSAEGERNNPEKLSHVLLNT